MTEQPRQPGAPTPFVRWVMTRPFAGGVLLVLAGAEILLAVKAPLPVLLHVGMQGLAGYLVPMIMLICGVLLLVNPDQRLFYSILGALLSLVSWVTSNVGGFFLGMVLGILGSALAFAWTPHKVRKRPAPAPAPAAAPDDPVTLQQMLDAPSAPKRD